MEAGEHESKPSQPTEPKELALNHARYITIAKAMLGQGRRSEAKQLLQAVVAQGLRALQQQHTADKDGDKALLPLQQLHVQALFLLGKAHGMAPAESDAAAHCFLLAASSTGPPLRPVALENLRVAFARLAALSGGGGAHRLASLHWDAGRHRALVAAAARALRSWRQQSQRPAGNKGARHAVILVTGPTAALLALLWAREMQEEEQRGGGGEAGVVVVEDSRVAAVLGRAALEANGIRVGQPSSPVLGFIESHALLQRLSAKAGGGGTSGGSMEERKERGKQPQSSLDCGEEWIEGADIAGLVFDPFPYTLPTLPLRILAALRRRQRQAFLVPDAMRFNAQLVESAAMRTLNQVAPEDGGRVHGFQLGNILDALGRRSVPVDPGSFPYRPLATSTISKLFPLASLLPLVDEEADGPATDSDAAGMRRTESTLGVRVLEKGRVDAALVWWDAGMLEEEEEEEEEKEQDGEPARESGRAGRDGMSTLISCAPPSPLLTGGVPGSPLPLVPLDELHRWQIAWLDFARFELDPSVGTVELQVRLEAPATASPPSCSQHMIDFSITWGCDSRGSAPVAPSLVDREQPEQILCYHIPMLNDAPRNAAYAAWLRWALLARAKAGEGQDGAIRVLDIGAGSGLLGMMAARLGRELGLQVDVVCLEKVAVLAAAAGWAVEDNGFSECVEVVNELSSDVAAADLGGRFHILVSEILGDQPLSESILPSFRHARSELLAPDALILPCRLTLWATVARIEGLQHVCAFPSTDGCDWAGWDCVLEHPLSLHLSAHERVALVEPVFLGTIDLSQSPLPLAGTLEAAAVVTGAGDANALILWFEAGLDGGEGADPTTICTGPAHGQRPHWKQVAYPLVSDDALVKGLRPGERLLLSASYHSDRLRLQVVGRE